MDGNVVPPLWWRLAFTFHLATPSGQSFNLSCPLVYDQIPVKLNQHQQCFVFSACKQMPECKHTGEASKRKTNISMLALSQWACYCESPSLRCLWLACISCFYVRKDLTTLCSYIMLNTSNQLSDGSWIHLTEISVVVVVCRTATRREGGQWALMNLLFNHTTNESKN